MADDLFGVFVENVNTGGINSNLNNIACFCGGLRRYAGNEAGFFADVKVEINFSTHKFGEFNISFNNCILEFFHVYRFIVEKFGGAKWLIDEMEIVK